MNKDPLLRKLPTLHWSRRSLPGISSGFVSIGQGSSYVESILRPSERFIRFSRFKYPNFISLFWFIKVHKTLEKDSPLILLDVLIWCLTSDELSLFLAQLLRGFLVYKADNEPFAKEPCYTSALIIHLLLLNGWFGIIGLYLTFLNSCFFSGSGWHRSWASSSSHGVNAKSRPDLQHRSFLWITRPTHWSRRRRLCVCPSSPKRGGRNYGQVEDQPWLKAIPVSGNRRLCSWVERWMLSRGLIGQCSSFMVIHSSILADFVRFLEHHAVSSSKLVCSVWANQM
jgi:hypothetical protein